MVQSSSTSNNSVVEILMKYLALLSIISIYNGTNNVNGDNFIAKKYLYLNAIGLS
jgi:hypothetical protein